MSNAVLERPPEAESNDWVILDEPPMRRRDRHRTVEMRGRGRQRHGVLARGRVRPAGRNVVQLPAVDDLD